MNYVQTVKDHLAANLPDCGDDLIDLYAMLALVKGTETTLKDVHEAWAIWRNRSNPNHRDLIPFDQLTTEVQERDRKYMDAIRAAAKAA